MPKAQTRLEILQVCKLLQCVREKSKAQIEKLTINGTPHLINYNDPDEGLTALIVAAKANDEDMIEFLLGLGAHPDVMDLKGRTAAMWASEFGNVECLEKLLNAGANMTLTDLDGKGILFYSMTPTERHSKCVEMALSNGANVNNIDKEGNPVFVMACDLATENERLCLELLKQGADPNKIQEKTGRTALMAAASCGGNKVVAALLEGGANVNTLDIKKFHASHFAAHSGHLQALMAMAGYEADFNKVNNEGNTPVHLASMKGHAMCIKFLSQRGCNPKNKNNAGNTPKVIAKEAGHKEAGKEIRKAEKTFGKGGKNNDPWVLQLYDWAMIRQEKLIDAFKKVDIDEIGKIGNNEFMDVLTAMQCPTEEEDVKRVISLQDKSREGRVDYNDFFVAKKWVNKNFLASAFEGKKKKKKKGKKGGKKGKFKLVMPICIQDEGPRTFGGAPPELYIPKHIHFTDTGRFDRDAPPIHPLQDDSAWYLQAPPKTYVNMNEAAKNRDFDSMKDAIARGVPVDTRDKYYKTPLMVACAVGNIDVVQYLLENGAAINAKDNFKWTPLHHACHAGQLDIVQLLVGNGAQIDLPTVNGGTPLTRAIESSRDQVVEYLIQKGAKMQTENKRGLTPMDIAYSWADPRVFEIVLSKWESLPTAKDQKGKKKEKKKRPQTAGPKEDTPQMLKLPDEEAVPQPRKGSILRAASALAGGLDEQEDITYTPKKMWTKQSTTNELLQDKVVKRERFGWEVDFPDFEMPFQQNVSKKVAIFEAEDEG